MNVCRDERLERGRRDSSSPQESSELGAHLATCADCRVASRMWSAFQGTAGACPGDERIVERAAKAALKTMRRPAPRWRAAIPAAAAILIAAGVASGAIALHARYVAAPTHVAVPAPPRTAQGKRHPATAPVAEPPLETPAAPASPETPADPVPAARPERTAALNAPPVAAPHRPVALAVAPPAFQAAPVGSTQAQRLFAQAVRARNEGRPDAAIGLFGELQRELADSDEAMVSLVSGGELLLARGRATEALAAFDGYLQRASAGVLAPEAQAGRVRALAHLGRTHDSEQAAAELARRFPRSAYARPLPSPALDGSREVRP